MGLCVFAGVSAFFIQPKIPATTEVLAHAPDTALALYDATSKSTNTANCHQRGCLADWSHADSSAAATDRPVGARLVGLGMDATSINKKNPLS